MKHHRTNSILSTLQSRKFREIVSDILITIGALVLVFYVWYVWLGDIVAGAKQDSAAAALSEEWEKEKAALPEFDRGLGSSEGALRPRKPPVVSAAMGQPFATLIIPRFGKNYERTVAESVDVKKVLNDPSTGVGHYSSTARLGEVGNFALAGHRTTFGAPFGDVHRLRVGDRIYLETKEGWFVYRFRNIEYVDPSQSDVLNDMPRETVQAKDQILTMTSCHPKLSEAERIIAYSVYESFVPRKFGVPSEIMVMRNK